MSSKAKDRIAVVAGLRTPFAKQASFYHKTSAIELGKMAVSELLAKTEIDPKLVEQVVYGQVCVLPEAPNIAREIVLGTGMNVSTDAYSVSRACATSFQSTVNVAESLMAGSIKVGVAGGADSTTVVPIQATRKLADTLLALSKAKTMQKRLSILSSLRPKDLTPVPPAVAEYSTGLTMGDTAEQMAKDYAIAREDQDALAHRSHTLAAKAWAEGKLDDEVLHASVPPYKNTLVMDNYIRKDSELSAYAKLRPCFDRKYGSVTAATSTGLTDGASAVLMMKESTAKALGYDPIGYIRSYAFAAIPVERKTY